MWISVCCRTRIYLSNLRAFWPQAGTTLTECPLVGIATEQYLNGSLEQNRQVKRETPIVDIPKIVFDASFDRRGSGSWSPASVHLRPSCQPRLYTAPKCVIPNHLVKLIVVGHRMRAWPHQRHAAFQHVEQLWQLIDARLAQQRAQARYSLVGKLDLNDGRAILEDRHRAKFVDLEASPVEAAAFLPEQDGSWRVEFDGNCHDREHRQQGRQGDPGEQDVNASLCGMLE